MDEKIMDKKYLNLLEDIRNTLRDIQFLQEDLGSLLVNPNVTLKNLMEIRDTLKDIQNLREGVEQDRETS